MRDNWVVSADWLADRLDEVRVVDVRDAWEYDGIGHLPGAVSVPFDEFRGGGDVGMLPPADRWEELLGNAGVASDADLVAYDDDHGVFAARFLVTALLLGHPEERLSLLDGDYSAWMRSQETTDEAPDVDPTDYEVRDPPTSPLVDADAVAAASESDAVLVDTRTPSEFAEGHISGAVNVDWMDLVDDESRELKPPDEIESILGERGITRDRRIVLYCNTARRISHTYVVLRWLGFDDVAFYEGSLTEWIEEGRDVVEG